MVARPPAPALFPYTTLFRSLLDALHQRARQRGGGGSRAEPAVHVGSAVRAREAVQELARHSALLAAQERDAVPRACLPQARELAADGAQRFVPRRGRELAVRSALERRAD